MRIGQLAKDCRCPVETIRYYEKIGLLPEAERQANGYRRYEASHRQWLQFILHSRALGFTQDEVRRLTNIANQPRPACAEVHDLLVAHIGDVRKKMRELSRMEASLQRLAAKCDNGALQECPVIDELMR